jgi:hypothetical protein
MVVYQYLGAPSSVVGFWAFRIPKGGTNILFKRTERTKHEIIHENYDDDDNSEGI